MSFIATDVRYETFFRGCSTILGGGSMVLIYDGNLEIGAHMQSDLSYISVYIEKQR